MPVIVPYPVLAISIHAPVKGATYAPFSCTITRNSISIHAPVKGATAI